MNTMAFFHAYRFTHFDDQIIKKTKNPGELSILAKLKTLLFGINNPRPENKRLPAQPFETVRIKSNREIECWSIKTVASKGTVILFHGFGGQKSSMLDKAEAFLKLGFDTFLVDFMGSGGSEGNQTTIGYLEAQQVKSCFNYLDKQGEKDIYLFGTSMGSVAILKAINDYDISPKSIIIECPFGSMYETVSSRFSMMNLPSFPMAGLLVFWGGIQNGFWAFDHNPRDYAKNVDCPVLLMYGEQDQKVSKQEIEDIYSGLAGKKRLIAYPKAGHENYLTKYKRQWSSDIRNFLLNHRRSNKT